MTPRIRNELRCIALLAFAFLIIFHREIFLGQTFIGGDILYQNYPRMMFIKDRLLNGEVPLWSPYIYAGFPLAAEGQAGVFYPLNLLLIMLPRAWSINGIVLLHLFLAAVSMYFLCRTLKIGNAGALAGALAYTANPFTLTRIQHTNALCALSWIPLLLALMEIFLRNRGRGALRHTLLIGAATGAMLLAGHPQFAFYGLIAAAVFGIFRAKHYRISLLKLAAPAAVTALTALLLASVQLLPMFELARHSIRSGGPGINEIFQGSFHPKLLITWILPHFYGAPWDATYHGATGEIGGGVGFPALVLAGAGLLYGNNRAARATFAALALVGILLALGRFLPFSGMIIHIPVLNAFRCPARAMVLWCLGASVLCGAGLDAVSSHMGNQRGHVLFAKLCFAAAIGLGGALLALLLFHSPIQNAIIERITAATHPIIYYEKKTNALLWLLKRDVFMAAAALVLMSRIVPGVKKPSAPHWAAAAVLALLCVDAAGIAVHFAQRTQRNALLYEPPCVERLRDDATGARTYTKPPFDYLKAAYSRNKIHPDSDYWHKNTDTLDFELPMLFSITSINGYGSLMLHDFAMLTHNKTYLPWNDPRPENSGKVTSVTKNAGELDPDKDHNLLRMLKVRRMIRPAPGNPARLELLDLTPEQAPISPLWVVCRGARVNPPRDVGFDPVSPPRDSGCRPRPVVIDRPAAGRIHIKTSMCCSGELVLMEKYYPGWRVTERMPDGSIRKRDHYERFTGIGVRLPEGSHELEYVFAPRSAHIGLAMGLLGLALSFVLVFVGKTKDK